MKRFALLTLASLGTILGAVVLWLFRAPVVLFLLAIAIAAAARPIVETLRQRRLPGAIALAVPYVVGLAVVIALFYVVGATFADELPRAARALTAAYENARVTWPAGSVFQRELVQLMPPASAFSIDPATLRVLAVGAWGVTLGVLGVTASIGAVLGMSVFWGMNRDVSERVIFTIFPPQQRPTARAIWVAVERAVGEQVRNGLGQSLATMAVLGVGFHVMRLDYPMLPAIIAAIAGLVPLIGAPIGILAAIASGLADGPVQAVAAGALTALTLLGVHFAVGRGVLKTRPVSSILLVLVVVVLGAAAGLLGLIFAPALAAAIQVFFERFLLLQATAPGHVADLAELERRMASLRSALEAEQNDGARAPAMVRRLLDRLDRLAAEARQSLPLIEGGKP